MIVINSGRLVFDGAMSDLNRVEGLCKQIHVVFGGPWSMEDISRLGTVRVQDGRKIVLEVKPEDATAVAASLFKLFPVKDITISDPRIEAIIESLYVRRVAT